MAAKRDVSGVFEAELKRSHVSKVTSLDSAFHLSHKGITFVSATFLPEWTEVDVDLHLPGSGVGKEQSIHCHGVVVQCARRHRGKGFSVDLIFLDLPKAAQIRLLAPAAAVHPFRISIAH